MTRRVGAQQQGSRALQQQKAAGLMKQLRSMRNREPWIYYDTRLFSTGIIPPDAAAVNFGQFNSPLSFFSQRQVGNASYALTNAGDTNKLEADFLCTKISIDVHCDVDAPSAAGLATATQFVEALVMYGILQINFGTVTKFVAPVCKFPSGGGVVSMTKIRTQVLAANSDSANAINGWPAAPAKYALPEPILFERGSAFTAQIIVDTNPNASSTQARIQAIQALTGLFKAMVRVNLEGVRGTRLLEGTPSSSF